MQNIHIIYTQYTKVQSVYIIRQAIINKRTKPFCFYEWYWIRVCATQFRYELSIKHLVTVLIKVSTLPQPIDRTNYNTLHC